VGCRCKVRCEGLRSWYSHSRALGVAQTHDSQDILPGFTPRLNVAFLQPRFQSPAVLILSVFLRIPKGYELPPAARPQNATRVLYGILAPLHSSFCETKGWSRNDSDLLLDRIFSLVSRTPTRSLRRFFLPKLTRRVFPASTQFPPDSSSSPEVLAQPLYVWSGQ